MAVTSLSHVSFPYRAIVPGLASLLLLVVLAGCGIRQSAQGTEPHRETAAPARAAAIAATARSAVGTPYAWGGCDPATGFDCSGLLYWAYARHGITLPRTTQAQAAAGTETGCTTFRQGDILVFRMDGSKKTGLHAGIYSGHGRFVHSPKSGHTVREESMLKTYWQTRLRTCRRIIP